MMCSAKCGNKLRAGSHQRCLHNRQRPQVACQAVAAGNHSRRQALLLSTGLAWLASNPAYASGVCADQDTAEAAAECRQTKLLQDDMQSYNAVSARAAAAERTAFGVPVAVLDDEYGKSTVALAEKIDRYFTMDVYDKQRAPLIKGLKADSNTWVSKYARGGNVRRLSARKMYIAVDAIEGHLASSGLAPFPVGKQKSVNSTIAEALTYLGEGKWRPQLA